MGNTRLNRDRNTQFNWDNTECARITAPIHDVFLQEAAQCNSVQALSEVISEVVGGRMAGRLSRNQRAARAWYAVNGSLEHRHTCGVYLKRPGPHSTDPVLGVYVDTSSRVTDFRANKELYLSRLANGGFRVSDIDFRLSRTGHAAGQDVGAGRQATRTGHHSATMPALTPEEEAEVAGLTQGLPDGLRQCAANAMTLSLRREKSQKTQSDTQVARNKP